MPVMETQQAIEWQRVWPMARAKQVPETALIAAWGLAGAFVLDWAMEPAEVKTRAAGCVRSLQRQR